VDYSLPALGKLESLKGLPENDRKAIFYEGYVPEKWKDFGALNREMAGICPSIVERKMPLADHEPRPS
jgi:hypothetical protein